MKIPLILDCTIRDGGFVNNWNFDKKVVRSTYQAASQAGLKYFEIGYFVTNKYINKDQGIWGSSPINVIQNTIKGIQGIPISIMIDLGKADIEDIPFKSSSPITLIRIAAHKNKLPEA